MRRLWLGFSSISATAILGILFSILVGITAFVPQGWLAVEAARLENMASLRDLYAWGLTDVARSPWFFGLSVLLVANLAAVALRSLLAKRALPDDATLASAAPHSATVDAPWPERAVEGVRTALTRSFGRPTTERVDGARVLMAFDTAPRARFTPLVTHLGLVLLVLGAALSTRPANRTESLVRATLVVKDTRGGSVGRFDLAQDEVRTFFQWRSEYLVRNYVADRNGLGPAIRMERRDPEERRMEDFWVYLDAPAGFDARHRAGQVSIEAKRMGLAPKPGKGLASRPEAVLLLLGLGLLALGARELGRPDGRLIVQTEGRQVRIAGVPRRAGDTRFGAAFDRWTALTKWSVES